VTRVEIFGKEYYIMKNYESPEISVIAVNGDIITASLGDTPMEGVEW
jgi:hypothetical protein